LKHIDPSEIEGREIEGIVDKIKSSKHTVLADCFYHIHNNLDLSNRNLKSLLDIPIKISKVDGDFYCFNDIFMLMNLEGDPNKLINLIGAPKEVGGNFDCSHNKLTSLEGASIEVGGNFHCSYNRLTNLEGAPKKVSGDFKCYFNPGPDGNGFTEEDVRAVSNVKGKIYV
jgi:hypothetical protein